MFGKHLSEETKKKISESHKGEKNPNFGKHLSEETKKKMSEARLGKKITEETRKKLSESHIGLQSGEKNPKVKLTWIQVREIREKYATGNFFQRQLAEEYNVHESVISHIITNKIWKE
jgi:hypothetical protein